MLTFQQISMRAFLLATGLLSAAVLQASCDGGETGDGGSAGAGGSTGGAGGGGSTGTSTDACASGCPSGQVCSMGACVAVPEHCPCPVETYCDSASNNCKVGCLADADCAGGHYCKTDERICLSGCRNNQECASGTTCLDHQCKAGCGSTADCKNGGETCVKNVCSCPGADVVCGTTCTELGTTANCGGCGDACQGAATCESGKCQCEPGKCGAATIVALADTELDSFDVDDKYVYYGKKQTEIYRTPVAGGNADLVVTDAEAIQSIKVAGSSLVYMWQDYTDFMTYKLKKVAASGGSPVTLDSGVNDLPQTRNIVGVGGNGGTFYAYWWAHSKMNKIDVSSGQTVASYTGQFVSPPYEEIVGDGFQPYHVGYSGGGGYSFYRSAKAFDFVSSDSYESFSIALADGGNLYFTDNTKTGSGGKASILLIKDNAHSAVFSGENRLAGLAADDVNLYWVASNGQDYEVRRGPKAGGSVTTLYQGKGLYPYGLTVHGGFVYWAADSKIWRIAQ